MKPLRDYFSESVCKQLKNHFAVEYVEQAQALTDGQLMSIRQIGKKFCYKLRNIEIQQADEYRFPPIFVGTLVYALEQLPRQATERQEIAVLQGNKPMTLVFERAPAHFFQWALISVKV